ncbi:putative nucleotidyltransferase substrate binding domain-containing protein [Thalassorhabdomicrobium marinisediminis]|uniref:Glutamine-synthetase adenylyltransferase n=1 Tax=Thalassorhabdomicrobium marinisediminis TaxID=2170577 RepID=A0A2T7G0Z9_9RHOB|nr:putative nucleotidyltransferase substrate binding domain-containing protein [Thalassorhabdomicrobium marinisediminis]PVA08089.1 glutamine-synthetase adenylyltransferase [Thalassorhabdomicrobium marinisediminis]
MNFASRLTRSPDPYDADRAAEGVAAFGDCPPEVRGLIAGAAGCSPYLHGLLAKEGDWLKGALDDPEAALEAELATAADLALGALMPGLRQAKRRVALLTALADLGGVWSLEEVTGALTRLADVAVDVTLKRLVAAEIKRGKLPGQEPQDAETAGGMVSIAMGKGGAHELNYSSDIDLICLFDETRFDPDSYHDARQAFVRVTRKMTATLSDLTGDGYVFRTDLRLRPDPSVTPVCLSMEAAERYYESLGRTWERGAYIKARASAGDIAAGEAFLQTLTPFVWRKHLDFVAIQDAHDMRLRIREHKGLGGEISLPGHDMKLGRGGIREIEFFAQTRQLIAGGRDPALRCRDTVGALAALAQTDWMTQEEADTLTAHYRAHREVEHRLQMLRDTQTHALPQSDEGFARLAAFMGTDVATLQSDLRARLEEVHTLTEGFFAPDEVPVADDFGAEITDRWATYPALRSPRSVEIFKRLKPQLMEALKDAAKPHEALLAFDGFLKSLPAGVQVFSLFEANPKLTTLIVDIAATAPALAQYLGRNAAVFDAVIGGDFWADWPGPDGLLAQVQEVLAREDDYEDRLDATRRWMKEWHFRIGVHHLQGLIDAETAGRQYADLARAVLEALFPVVVEQFAEKHGAPPGRGAVVVGMGSLGAGRLHAASDLDLIVIYDGAGVEASEGRRPLATRPYYARLTQALVTALTAPMAEGRLYEVDMRLRPSGGQGPVATALAGFEPYQMEEAWTWEHLALTRARVIAGDAGVAADVEAVRERVLQIKGQEAGIAEDVAAMRARIAGSKPAQGQWDAKVGPGRLQDVELAAQMVALQAGSTVRATAAQIEAGRAAGLLDAAQAETLTTAADLCWRVQAAAQLVLGTGLDAGLNADKLGEGARRFLLRETDTQTLDDLAARMDKTCSAAARVIAQLVGESDGKG